MKKYLVFTVLVIGTALLSVMPGCGQATETSTTTTTSGTTTTLGDPITLSGSLTLGTVGTSVYGAKSYAAAPNYKVVAVDYASGQTYYTESDSSGDFSLVIPGGTSYEVSLIDSNNQYLGPVVMSGDSSSSEVIMGISPSDDANLGEITVDTSSNYAQPTAEPTAILNDDVAEATAGAPKGATEGGKEQISVSSTVEGADIDNDGIPNIFDPDEDDDGYRNGILADASFKEITGHNTIESIYYTSNIWAEHGNNTGVASTEIAWRIHVVPVSEAALSDIASVAAVSVPASISEVATVRVADSLGSPTDYPAEDSLWESSNYGLYLTTTSFSPNQYIISIKPNGNMNVGDIFTIRVYYTGGGYQDFFISTSYVLTDWARITTYNYNTMTSGIAKKNTTDVLAFSTPSMEVVFTKPLDEDDNVLEGLVYSIIVSTTSADGSTLLVPSVSGAEYKATAYPAAFTEGADTWTVKLQDLVTFAAGYYYITPVAESADGQRNGEEYWFKKE
ncbi:hypothetical protein ACFL5U_03905 [Candidatus Margulisiibacteriota bacterium]